MGAEHAFRLCPCTEPCNCIPGHLAAASSARFLRERFEHQPCDSDGVSDCVRCTVIHLVTVAEKALAGNFRYVTHREGGGGWEGPGVPHSGRTQAVDR